MRFTILLLAAVLGGEVNHSLRQYDPHIVHEEDYPDEEGDYDDEDEMFNSYRRFPDHELLENEEYPWLQEDQYYY